MTVASLNSRTTGLVIIDAQTKLLAVMRRGQTIVDNILRLLFLADQFQLPVIATEQYPRMMGSIAPEIRERLPKDDAIRKMSFDCCQVDAFNQRLKATGIRCVILAGLEAHICVFQTCLGLLEAGYSVHIPQDAVDSRSEENWQVGIGLMKEAGAMISSTETAIFQVLNRADAPQFKDMLRIIK